MKKRVIKRFAAFLLLFCIVFANVGLDNFYAQTDNPEEMSESVQDTESVGNEEEIVIDTEAVDSTETVPEDTESVNTTEEIEATEEIIPEETESEEEVIPEDTEEIIQEETDEQKEGRHYYWSYCSGSSCSRSRILFSKGKKQRWKFGRQGICRKSICDYEPVSRSQ